MCKSLWEKPHERLRLHAEPWQTRIELNDGETLAIAMRFALDDRDTQSPHYELFYDHALFVTTGRQQRRRRCLRGSLAGW